MKRRTVQFLMLTLATTAAALVGALPSAAEGVLLRNYRTQFLNAVPSADMPTSCTSQHVDLPAGEYEWTARYWSEPTNNWDYAVFRAIRLAAGGYTWTDCLKPMTGYYIHTSELDPDKAGLQTAAVTRNVWMSSWTSSGVTQWGSVIDMQS